MIEIGKKNKMYMYTRLDAGNECASFEKQFPMYQFLKVTFTTEIPICYFSNNLT